MRSRLRSLYRRLFPAPEEPLRGIFPADSNRSASGPGYALEPLLDAKIEQAMHQQHEYAALAAQHVIPGTRQLFQNLYVIDIALKTGVLNVYETGGAAGNWYHIINSYTGGVLQTWTIREQEALVKRIQHKNIPLPSGVSFVSERRAISSGEASKTLYMAQGVLQYLPDPLDELRWAFAQGFRFVYLTRTPVLKHGAVPFAAMQRHLLGDHAPGIVSPAQERLSVEIPLTLVPEALLFQTCPENYTVVFKTVESDDGRVKHTEPPVFFHDIGVLFKKTD